MSTTPTTEPTAEFPILEAGSYPRGTITEGDLIQAVRNFDAERAEERAELAIDYDHSHAKGRGSRAAGWIKGLRREGGKLIARIAWTPSARELLSDGEYRYVSAEFSRDATNERGQPLGFAILGAGLTNRPYLRGLGPVTFGEVPSVSEVERLLDEADERFASGDRLNLEAERLNLKAVALMAASGSTYAEAVEAARKDDDR